MVKDRNEPCTMIQVLEVVAGKFYIFNRIFHLIESIALKEISEQELAETAWENTMKMFNLNSIQ